MGRGRAKAKQTKVARELKYHSPNTDLAALQRELGGAAIKSDEDIDEYDEYDVDDPEDQDEDPDPDPNWAVRRP
ncbi:DUF3073 domain-containing protein [Hamadaea tsunoensis]|uniref:DUF3073 domain-containing protein n=1 Tax=Hamadaea tsunoensis TaxID=53368 RepID=UPI000488F970|nr:DUF3073 domain-containing protein [Hamadaea tsunoensis]